jgi:hypothetical protein
MPKLRKHPELVDVWLLLLVGLAIFAFVPRGVRLLGWIPFVCATTLNLAYAIRARRKHPERYQGPGSWPDEAGIARWRRERRNTPGS